LLSKLLSKWPQEATKEAKEGREGKESNHNRKEKGDCAEI
jgi:hypothetical protein